MEGYFRYVDDILLVYEDNLTNTDEVLNLFNNITWTNIHVGMENKMAG